MPFGYRTQTQFEILTPAQYNLVEIFVLYNLLNLFENLNKLISHLQCFSPHLTKMTILMAKISTIPKYIEVKFKMQLHEK